MAMMDICTLNGFCLMSQWSAPFRDSERLCQERHCVACNKIEYRTVEAT